MIDLVRRFPAALWLVLLACGRGNGAAPVIPAPTTVRAPTPPPLRSDANIVPGEYLVTLAPEVGEGLITELFGKFGVQRVQSLGRNVFLVAFQPDPGIDSLEKARAGDSRVTAVQPNYVYKTKLP